MVKVVRNANIELLRLLCMLAIVVHHSVLYSGVLDNALRSDVSFIYPFMFFGGKIAADCFLAITAFFLINSKKNNEIKKAFKIYGTTWLYGIAFLLLFLAISPKTLTAYNYAEAILPITYNAYWFISSFVLLLVFSPALKTIVEYLSKKQLKRVIIAALILFVLPCSLLPGAKLLVDISHIAVSFIIFLVVAYIEKYRTLDRGIKKKARVYLLTFSAVSLAISLIILGVGKMIGSESIVNNMFYHMSGESLFSIVPAISLLYITLNMKPRKNKTICFVSSAALDIYLIHMNHLVYLNIWNNRFLSLRNYSESWLFPIIAILYSILICTVCLFIGKIRQAVFRLIRFDIITNKIGERYENN